MMTTITGKNQATIPAELVKQLDIRPGTRVGWSVGEDGTLIARLLPNRGTLARKATGMGRKWLTADADPVAELIQERIREDQDEGLA